MHTQDEVSLQMDQHATIKETTTAEARVSAAQLTEFAARVFIAAGLPQSDAHTIAALMVEADLRGSDTHGVIRLPLYVRRLRAGGINAKPNIRLISDRSATARRRAYLASGRAEPCKDPRSPRARHSSAQGAARESRRRRARSQDRAA
jgi:hypothetical protein